MALDPLIKQRLERALGVVDDHGSKGTRLLEDAQRLCSRINALLKLGIVPVETDPVPMEMACYALQLPLKSTKTTPAGKLGRPNLRERAQQGAEMLANLLADASIEPLLEATSQLLLEIHQKKPENVSAQLLADALNLEDFGVGGLMFQAIQIARQGGGVLTVADGLEKREQYGYWDARLKDGFHFDQVRQLARKRLDQARKVATLLANELKEDGIKRG